ncbi:XRE family transcriptional regulator, partial [Clostridioides difficile]|nr:XRE family transcriptional regulator [Clostridioides difficile]
QTRQNLSNKFSRDNFSEKEIREFAEILDCEFDFYFIMNDTEEKI